MKNVARLSLLALTFSTQIQAGTLVVYGEDNRTEVYDASKANQILSQSTATMVPVQNLKLGITGTYDLNQTSLKEMFASMAAEATIMPLEEGQEAPLPLCEETPFINQPNAGVCSGFLIAPDLVVTAGHCTKIPDACKSFSWVFGYEVDKKTQKAGLNISTDNVYGCKKIISSALAPVLNLDYGVIQLDRPVVGRVPLEIRNTGKIADNSELVVIGSPSGQPLKVAAGAKVRTNTSPFSFLSNLDTFQGNSGSAVFNAKTGVVEGILVYGETDYTPNETKTCMEVKRCADDGCRGEASTRLTAIPEVAVQKALYSAAESGDLEALAEILEVNFWIDFYGKDGQSALIKAARALQTEAMAILIVKGADINLKDANGDTATHHLVRGLTNKNRDLLNVLTSVNADLDVVNNRGETPLSIAKKKWLRGGKLAQELISAGAKNSTPMKVLNSKCKIAVFPKVF